MQSFFAINVMLDLHSATELMMTTIGELERLFPTSVHLKASRALVLYHMRGKSEISPLRTAGSRHVDRNHGSTEFEEAEQAFDDVREIDPYRLEEIEIYSNMLYVMNRKAKLGKLAHEYGEIDKNRAEVCCLIGEHGKRLDL
jgi:anaphase-promoting complex subunit 8